MPKARTLIKRLLRNDVIFHGAVVFTGLAVANAFNYLFYMLAGRVLGVEPYGELTSLTSALLTLAAPASVAQIIVARLASGMDASGDRSALRRLSRISVSLTSAAVILVLVVAMLFRDSLAGFFHSTSLSILATAIALGAYAVATVQRGILQGVRRFDQLSASYIIETLVRVVVGIPLAVSHGVFGGMIGAAIGAFASLGYNVWVLNAGPCGNGREVTFDVTRAVRIASHIGVAQLTLTALSFYDVALVRHVFDARSAGLFAAAALVGRAMLGALQFVPTIIMPKATARAAAGGSALPLLASGIGMSAVIVGTGSLIAGLAPGTLVVLLAGNAFYDAAPIVFPYVLAASALGFANVVTAYQIGLHRYQFVIPSLIVAIVEVTVNVLWHPSPSVFVAVLLVGHVAFLATSLIGLGARL